MSTSINKPWYLRKRVWVGAFSSVGFLSLAVRRTDWHDTLDCIQSASIGLLAAGALAFLGTMVLFAVRWQVILAGSRKHVTVKDTFALIMVGYLANNLLPLRMGDLIRAGLLGLRHKVNLPASLGTIMLERVLDLLTVLVLACILVMFADLPPMASGAIAALLTTGIVGFSGLLVLAHSRRLLARMRAASMQRKRCMSSRVVRILIRLSHGVRVLRSRRRLLLVGALSIAAWGLTGVALTIWIKAFDLPVPWYTGLQILAIVNIGGTIPSSPGFIGVYHYLVVAALATVMSDENAALGFALVTHALMTSMKIGLGGFFLLSENLLGDFKCALTSGRPGPTPNMSTDELS